MHTQRIRPLKVPVARTATPWYLVQTTRSHPAIVINLPDKGETAPEGGNMRSNAHIQDSSHVLDSASPDTPESPLSEQALMHKYSIGQLVYFEGAMQYDAARGQYKIVRLVPIERDNRVIYRIKNAAEAFERTAEEHQLRTALA